MSATNMKRKADKDGPGGKKSCGHWSQGLKSSMDDPDLRVFSDDKIVIIKDKYPKARHHFLVLPKEHLPNLKSLTKEKLELLRHMHDEGLNIAKEQESTSEFRLGYHAIPSMSQVHLHVISQDFDSPSLKTKKHWNSFTSEYFVDSTEVMKRIEKDGKFVADTVKNNELLKKPLKCHRCHKDMKTMPALKEHIKCHIKKKDS